jgi:uncharacterized membrane protein
LASGELLDAAFNMLRRASRENADVPLSMLAALETIARKSICPKQQAELRRHVHLIEEENRASQAINWDQERVQRRCAVLDARLESPLGVESERFSGQL